ncbi:molybdate ABC transporter substrate-binding protein [Helicobacter sp. 11S02629-2]|uniref:molybdate ABC transporter substrate-binding protein n=1 Tax=Helicobacter sp. 11S02629-2 TaxID=1476195 RepID=UPI000BA509D5|nr:molybdate ABC transporter substrate-binding protein [Helicobacter sp. 11S02629-2]PAF45728.1 molybdate ABC transporter substrate-binding protein [Helicobacter sp. 11S02629-2]
MKFFMKAAIVALLGVNSLFASHLEILAAANLRYVLQDVKTAFLKEHPKDTMEITFDASGRLYAKVTQGLKADLFISADESFPNKLYEAKLATKPVVYTQGILVLWSDGDMKVTSLDDMLKAKNIALPNPQTAPYGRAALEALKNSGLYSKVESKIATALSISQANQYVISRNAQIGFNALSMVRSQKNASILVVDSKLYSPIKQAMSILNSSDNKALAKEFYDFILSPKGQKIFAEYGYKALK